MKRRGYATICNVHVFGEPTEEGFFLALLLQDDFVARRQKRFFFLIFVGRRATTLTIIPHHQVFFFASVSPDLGHTTRCRASCELKKHRYNRENGKGLFILVLTKRKS